MQLIMSDYEFQENIRFHWVEHALTINETRIILLDVPQ